MPVFRTRLTELLGIEHPIVCGGMFELGRAELAAAVSEAGGLGTITSATFPDPADLRQEIRRARSLTAKPIAVNLSLFPASRPIPNEEYIRVTIEEGVRIVETSGRSPEPYMPVFKQYGVKVIHKVPGVKFARTAERIGCDAVSVVGLETGGHPGADNVGTLVLAARAAESVSIPLIVGGGIADARGLVAALALGADGVLMGTRFMATRECQMHPQVKDWMVQAAETDTMIIQESLNNQVRVARNRLAQEVIEKERQGADLHELLPLITGLRTKQVYQEGNIDGAVWGVGQSVGLIHSVPTVRELLDGMVTEAARLIGGLNEKLVK